MSMPREITYSSAQRNMEGIESVLRSMTAIERAGFEGIHLPMERVSRGNTAPSKQRPVSRVTREPSMNSPTPTSFVAQTYTPNALDLLEGRPTPTADQRQHSHTMRNLTPSTSAVEKELEESFLRDLHSSDLGLLYHSLEQHSHSHPSKSSPRAVNSRTVPGPPRSQPMQLKQPQSLPVPANATSQTMAMPPQSAPSRRRPRSSGLSTAAAAARMVLTPSHQHRKMTSEVQHERWVADTAAALKSEQHQVKHAASATWIEARTQLEVVKASLPMQFLAQQQFAQDAKKEGMRKIMGAINKLVSQAYAQAWGRWLEVVAAMNLIDLVAAAEVVQRTWRSHSVQRYMKGAAARRAAEKGKAKVRCDKRRAQRERAAAIIASVTRRARLRRVAWRMVGRLRAARVVQRGWGRVIARRQGWHDVGRRIREGNAAGFVQRAFRGYMGRKRFRKLRRLEHHRRGELRFESALTTRLANYEMNGAAKTLQLWWQRLPWRVRRAKRQAQLFYSMRLQVVIRGWLARRRIRLIKEQRFGAGASHEEVAAMQIQRFARGVASRTKHGRTGSKGRAMRAVAALKEWLDHKCAAARGGEAKARVKLEEAATVMARIWRGFAAHRSFELRRVRRLGDTVAILQLAVVRFLKRKRKPAALRILKRWVHSTLARQTTRRKAVTLLQASWRRHLAQRRHLVVLWARRKLSFKFVPVLRALFARAAAVRAEARAIWRAEDRIAGAREFFMSREDEIKRQILVSTRVVDPELPAEAQVLFVHYASFGNKGNTTRLGVNGWSKLLKESPGLLDNKHMTTPAGELIFTKSLAKLSGGGNESHLLYGDFLEALKRVVAAKYKDSRGDGKWGHRLKGEEGNLVKILQEHFFLGAPAKKLFKKLKSQSAAGRADTHIRDIVVKLQNGFRNHTARKIFHSKRSGASANKSLRAQFRAALMFQKFWHRLKAKRNATLAAMQVYEKFIDEESGRPYWFNANSGTAVWTKPAVLGKEDLGNPVNMPSGPRVFTVECSSCADRLATTLCIECNDLHCVDCSSLIHKSEKRKQHIVLGTEVCIQCEFQVACRRCYTCKDNYCDACFEVQHAKGMLQRHDYKPLVDFCEECGKLAARQIVYIGPPSGEGDNPEQPSGAKLCHVCTESTKDSHPCAFREPLPYRPLKLGEWFAKAEAEREARRIEEEFERRKQEAARKVEDDAATAIQRVWRGCLSRQSNEEFVEMRKAWLRQRQIDNKVRAKLPYRVKKIFGYAPELESDTIMEKVLKRYPVWCTELITDVVHGEWTECYEMVQEQDAHRRANSSGNKSSPNPFASLGSAVEAWHMATANAQLQVAARHEAAKQREADAATAAYRNARSTLGVTETEKEDLQQEMREAKAEHESAKARLAAAQSKVDKARAIRVAKRGPKRLAERVATVRKQGWALGVKVSATNGSFFLAPNAGQKAQGIPKPLSLQPGQRVKLQGSHAVYCVAENSSEPPALTALYQKRVGGWVRFAGKMEGLDAEAVAARTPKWTFTKEQAASIKVDRCWTYQDAKQVTVSVLPRLPLHEFLAFRVKRNIQAAGPVQAAVKAWERGLAAGAARLASTSALFDEEAPMHSRLLRYAAQMQQREESVRHMRTKITLPGSYVSMYSEAISLRNTLRRILYKGQAQAREKRKEQAKLKQLATDPLQKFLDSPHQLEVAVAWQAINSTEGGENPEPEALGFMMVDTEIPCSLARTLVGRYLWPELNKKGGHNFTYQLDRENAVDITKEANTKVDSVLQQKLDPTTKRVEYTLVLRPDPGVKGVAKIEPWNWDDKLANLTNRKPLNRDDGEDESDEVRFKRVRAQIARHMVEVRKHLGIKEPEVTEADGEALAASEEAAADAGPGEWRSALDDEGVKYWYNNNEITYDDPVHQNGAEPEWTMSVDDDGQPCYYNTKTGETTYEDPL